MSPLLLLFLLLFLLKKKKRQKGEKKKRTIYPWPPHSFDSHFPPKKERVPLSRKLEVGRGPPPKEKEETEAAKRQRTMPLDATLFWFFLFL